MNFSFRRLFSHFRNFLLRLLNKEFLIFLFFRAVSGVFWLIITLNESLEKEVSVPVEIVNVPDNIVLTSEFQDTIKVTLRDKGYVMAAYWFTDHIQPLKINFANYSKSDGHGVVSAAELQRLIRQQLYKSTDIRGIKPEKIDLYFNHGLHKKVPVMFRGKIEAAQNYFITQTKLVPDSVDVYATNDMLNSITFVTTEYTSREDVSTSERQPVQLLKKSGVKLVPPAVSLEIDADVLTESTFEVPVVAVNMPEGKVLRTFPSQVKVRFVVGSHLVDQVFPSDFRVEVDYHEIENASSDKCTLKLVAKPELVIRASLEIEQVDYLIEQL